MSNICVHLFDCHLLRSYLQVKGESLDDIPHHVFKSLPLDALLHGAKAILNGIKVGRVVGGKYILNALLLHEFHGHLRFVDP